LATDVVDGKVFLSLFTCPHPTLAHLALTVTVLHLQGMAKNGSEADIDEGLYSRQL
jgi:hypothetical protein